MLFSLWYYIYIVFNPVFGCHTSIKRIVLFCIALYCIVLYFIALHCIALHCIALYCIVFYFIALHCIALHCIALHYIALYCELNCMQHFAAISSAGQLTMHIFSRGKHFSRYSMSLHSWNYLTLRHVQYNKIIAYTLYNCKICFV